MTMMICITLAKSGEINDSVMDRIIEMNKKIEMMDEKIEYLVNTVQNVANQQKVADLKMEKIADHTTLIKALIFNNWKFQGYGRTYGTTDSDFIRSARSFADCASICSTKQILFSFTLERHF